MKKFQAKRAIKSHKQHLNAPPSKIFPLLCPVREYEWIEGWNCEMIYTDSGLVEENCIFTTSFLNDENEIWVVIRYEKDREIQFIRVSSGKVIRLSVKLTDNGDGSTTALWTQVITGLNERGNHFIEHFTDEAYARHMGAGEAMLNHFLATGEMLKMSLHNHQTRAT